MYIFFLVYLIALFLIKDKLSARFSFLWFLPFILVPFLRFGFGADYFSYEYIYDSLDTSSFANMLNSFKGQEIGMRILMYFCKKLNLSFHTFLGLLASGISCIVLIPYRKNVKYLSVISILFYSMFFYAWSLNAVRQAIVIYLSTYIIFFLDIKTFKKTLLLLILAMFHYSALITIPLFYAAKYLRVNLKFLIIGFLVCVVMAYIPYADFMNLLTSFPIFSRIVSYLKNAQIGLLNLQAFMRIFFILILLMSYKVFMNSDNEDKKFMYKYSLLSLFLYIVLSSMELIAARLSVFGFFVIVYLVPVIYYELNLNRLLKFLAISVFSLLFFTKEFNASIRQSGYQGNFVEAQMVTIFSYDRSDWFNNFNVIHQVNKIHQDRKEEFRFRYFNKFIELTQYDTNNEYISVRFPNGKYGVIDTDGKILIDGTYETEIKVIGNLLKITPKNDQFKPIYLFLSDMTEADEASILIQKDIQTLQNTEIELDPITEGPVSVDDLDRFDNIFLRYDIRPDILTKSTKINYNLPYQYTIYNFQIFSNSYYFIYNDNLGREVVNNPYTGFGRVDNTGVFVGKTRYSSEIINSEGKLIWIE